MQFRIPVAITRRVGHATLVASKHSPKYLFIGGVVGMVGTTVLASKATLKLDDVLKEAQKDLAVAEELVGRGQEEVYSEHDRRKDVAYIYFRSVGKVVKLYGPAFILGVTSVAMLTKSHNILSRRNAALAAGYAAMEKAFLDYRGKVIKEYGEDKDREIRFGTKDITTITESTNGPKKKTETVLAQDPFMYSRRFDNRNQNWQAWSEANRGFLLCQQRRANDMLWARGHLSLNEVYDMLGIERTPQGQLAGWVRDSDGPGDDFVDFGCFVNEDSWRPGVLQDLADGHGMSVLLDFNVQGNILDSI